MHQVMPAIHPPWPLPPPQRPPRWRAVLPLAGLVLVLHAGLLGRLPPAPGAERARGAARPLQVRQIVPGPAPAAPPQAQAARPHVRPALPTAALAPVAPWAAAPPAPRAVPEAALPDAEPALATREPPEGSALPAYATQLPPAATLGFELRRGARSGQAELTWRPQADRYELTLQSAAFGAQAPGAASRGGFDAAGIAPERFVDRRRGRDQRAVNFQRESGLVTFSGPPQAYPLPAGAQDTLSWMLQLPAILQANPALATPGSRVSMWVAGARGQADVWTFVVQDTQGLALPAGPVASALRLLRQPQRPYDTQVEVWLDPARHHLPVRIRIALRPEGQSTEFLLLRADLP